MQSIILVILVFIVCFTLWFVMLALPFREQDADGNPPERKQYAYGLGGLGIVIVLLVIIRFLV